MEFSCLFSAEGYPHAFFFRTIAKVSGRKKGEFTEENPYQDGRRGNMSLLSRPGFSKQEWNVLLYHLSALPCSVGRSTYIFKDGLIRICRMGGSKLEFMLSHVRCADPDLFRSIREFLVTYSIQAWLTPDA